MKIVTKNQEEPRRKNLETNERRKNETRNPNGIKKGVKK